MAQKISKAALRKCSCSIHILRSIEEQFIRELRLKYIQNPPKGITATLVKNMTDNDLLDMHYFLTEDDLDDEPEEGFYIF